MPIRTLRLKLTRALIHYLPFETIINMEKITFRSRFALLLAILIAPLAGVSAAGLIDLNTNSSAAANASAAAQSALDATANGNGTVNSAVSGSDVNANGAVNAGVNTNASTNVNGSANAQNGSSNANTNSAADLNATNNASSMSVWNRESAEVNGTVAPEMTADSVQTDSDLKTFAATALRNDDNLDSIGFASDRVEVAYREPARFLGIFPASVNIDVVAHNDGSVDIDYPWYSFLMVTNRADLESSIKNEVGAYMSQSNASETGIMNSNGNSALHASTTVSTTATSTASTSSNAHWNARTREE